MIRRTTSKPLGRDWLESGVVVAALVLSAALSSVALPGTAMGQEPDETAREAAEAAAREVGATGQAAAQTVATDASQALEVPGFEGTDLSEARLAASELGGAAQRALGDRNDVGGAVGTFVAESAQARPDADLSVDGPEVRRAETIEASPNAVAWRADGLGSGMVNDCNRGVGDAQSGGRCGSVTYCVGAGCERVDTPANTGFVNAAARLNMVMEMGTNEFDRRSMRIFSGESRACTIRFLGLQNCCNDTGVFVESGLLGCSAGEIELAEARAAGVTHYLGEYCARRILGICRRRDRAWCVFTSQLGRILHEQARPQLGIGWGNCDGFTVAQIERIDFDRVDLSEFTATLLDENSPPGVSLPEAGTTGDAMRERIRRYSRDND